MKVYPLEADSEEQATVVVARTSRNPLTFDQILADTRAKGHKEFLKKNVIGYGHDSVAQGAIPPWIVLEDISDIAANVIATSHPLVTIQMTSTRYQDMGKRTPFEQGDTGVGLMQRDKYMWASKRIDEILAPVEHPAKRTLQCDMARAFLTAGISTQFALRADARALRDIVNYCLGHRFAEVQEAGRNILAAGKQYIEVLFDRHVQPVASEYEGARPEGDARLGDCVFNSDTNADLKWADTDVLRVLRQWRDSGYHMHLRAHTLPFGPFPRAWITSDWGAYRDLRRQRTMATSDVLPNGRQTPADALWAFRELYPDLCESIEKAEPSIAKHYAYVGDGADDPYIAPMGTRTSWCMGGHILHWAYMLRLRSPRQCHPAYALPMRRAMRAILEFNDVADAMGIVESKKSLGGVEFVDRIGA